MAEIKLRDFQSQILYFNGMYKLPVAPYPTVNNVVKDMKERLKDYPDATVVDLLQKRLADFSETLKDELSEAEDIMCSLRNGHRCKDGQLVTPVEEYTQLDFLVDMADWLGDIQVYCASEMSKYGIPLKETLATIMASNFSKLGIDGEAIYDARGKVQKGPGYWKPEPQLKQMLIAMIQEATITVKPTGIVWRE